MSLVRETPATRLRGPGYEANVENIVHGTGQILGRSDEWRWQSKRGQLVPAGPALVGGDADIQDCQPESEPGVARISGECGCGVVVPRRVPTPHGNALFAARLIQYARFVTWHRLGNYLQKHKFPRNNLVVI